MSGGEYNRLSGKQDIQGEGQGTVWPYQDQRHRYRTTDFQAYCRSAV
jgi:hypothetical protein